MSETNEKTTWHERLVVEHAELKEKLVKLVSFINSEEYYKLSENHRTVLQNQKITMELYLQTLSMRLYEDLDKCTVPNFGALSVIANMFGGPWSGNPPVGKSNISEVGAPEPTAGKV